MTEQANREVILPWQRAAVESACHLRNTRYVRPKSELRFFSSKQEAEGRYIRLRKWQPMVGGEGGRIVRFWAAHIVGTKHIAIVLR